MLCEVAIRELLYSACAATGLRSAATSAAAVSLHAHCGQHLLRSRKQDLHGSDLAMKLTTSNYPELIFASQQKVAKHARVHTLQLPTRMCGRC